ncbi:MAG: Ig-like domain-containing protein [Intrasporangium sp.]|uniref:Ig-like domain-containing protein n=1 Tax=Intrasporangium sp. TaxID=1925024 RepID=UPI00264795AF|nr:Ig-like domain-containing protein [Intrasporangium sp.]MDN5795648.1 Ig-like domain-containing protein [Intrasporangium sp.]
MKGRALRGMIAAGALALATAVGAVPVAAPSAAAPAGTVHYPDLQNIIPTGDMSIHGSGPDREFRYTHLLYNGGDGPLEIQPQYNNASGTYQGVQRVYTHDASGTWSIAEQSRVGGAFVYHAEHGHFHFPMASFGLYAVAADGGVGDPVTMSPKNGFCIADSYIYDKTLEHSGTFGYSGGTCTDPSAIRGISVGGADEYDYRDPGQSVPIADLPDGTYWFRALVDPYNYFQESDKADNETDVKVRITGSTLETLGTTHPDSTPPPSTLTAPTDGSQVHGTVTLTAATPPAGSQGVQFIVDGQPVGDRVTTGPFGYAWDTTTVTNGTHWVAAQVTDAHGYVGTSAVAEVSVSNGTTPPPPPPEGVLALDQQASADGTGPVTATLSTGAAGDLLLAFVGGDGPGSGGETATVSGAGLKWSLVGRANNQPGTSEIWQATASGQLSDAAITSTLGHGGYGQSLTVVAFSGAAGVGTSAGDGARTGAPTVSLTTTADGAWVYGVGNDWDQALPRTAGDGQHLVHQWVDSRTGDTYWAQSQVEATATKGTTVTLDDPQPTGDRWNLMAVEVLPSTPPAPPPPDTTAPSVSISDPADGATVSGEVRIAAVASDDVGVTSVAFHVDGSPVGDPVTSPPFTTTWSTGSATAGQHTLTAVASDAAGNTTTSAPATVTVDNSTPAPARIAIDGQVSKDASNTMTTPAFSTSAPGDVLLALVAYDGPSSGPQTATVSGAGLTWTLVKRSNIQSGTSEIWSAKATGTLAGAKVTSTPARKGYHGSLTVLAFTNADDVGVAGAASAPNGEPDVYLPGVEAGAWVFAVGNDWDRAVARTPVDGQVLVHQRVDTSVGDTFWTQSTAAPSTILGVVDIHDSAPADDQWNYAAVAVLPAPAG